jgi:glycosyltransferase involved in cell wall biosynthesis
VFADSAARALFWLCAAALFYTYVGYPLLLVLISKLRWREVVRADWMPGVSVIITAYNEERDLASKLENTLSLDYPPEKLEIIVASDCSGDRTDEIARSFAARGVILHRQPERLGKTAAQNAAVERARGEILLFSDATTLYRPDVLRVIVRNFADPTVGCAAGRLIYVDPAQSSVGRGARSYWDYEVFLKERESGICSLIGVSGCLYAVRRSAYVPLYHEACSDFLIATKMVEQGLRAVYEPAAVCTEETNSRVRKEMRMRVRVIAQTYTDLWRHRSMMNPWRSGFYAVQLVSHKVMRYLVPIFLLVLLAASAALAPRSSFYALVLIAQAVCYAAAAAGWLLERAGKGAGPLAFPQYFVLANLAALIAFYQFLRGERYARWEPIREPAAGSAVNTADMAGSRLGAGRAVAPQRAGDYGEQFAAPEELVSVIVPAYNAAAFIGAALDSVLAQTYIAYELIVVNDGSPDTDKLEQALEPYRGRITYIKQENRGPSGARNVGILKARGEYVALLDSDDMWEPRYLAEQMKVLLADPTLTVVYSDALLFGDSPLSGRTFMESTPTRCPVTFEGMLKWECSVLTSCVVARKRPLLDAGLFDERFMRSEDFDLWLRVLHRGGRIECNRQVLARHRLHAQSLAASYTGMVLGQSEVFKKIAAELPLTPEVRELVAAQLTKCEAYVALHEGKQRFLAGQHERARELLAHANETFRSRKLRAALIGLRYAPHVLHRLYRYRRRGVVKQGGSGQYPTSDRTLA